MTKRQTKAGHREPWKNETARGRYPEHVGSPVALRDGAGGASESEEFSKPPFDLQERTAKCGEAIIRFVKRIPRNPVNNRIIDQLVGCGTGVGGNYCEADEAVSKKDFHNKIGTCKKEAKEAKFFLRMAATAEPGLKEVARDLWREVKELHLIFAAIFRGKREE